MHRNTPGNNLRDARRRIANASSTHPSNPADDGATQPVKVIAEKLEVEKLLAPASPFERVAARVGQVLKPARSKKEIKQQKEALSTWEDEGGPAAPPAVKPNK